MVWRTITLMVSDAPNKKSTPSESAKLRDTPKMTVNTPNAKTHQSMVAPAQRAEPGRADFQNLARVNGQQRNRAAQQHGEQIERHCAQDEFIAPNILQALQDHAE